MQTCAPKEFVLNQEETTAGPNDVAVKVCINLSRTGAESLVLIQDSDVPSGHLELTIVTITQDQGYDKIVVEGHHIKLYRALTRLYAKTSQNDGGNHVGILVNNQTQTEDDVAKKKTEGSASESFLLGLLMGLFYSCTGC